MPAAYLTDYGIVVTRVGLTAILHTREIYISSAMTSERVVIARKLRPEALGGYGSLPKHP